MKLVSVVLSGGAGTRLWPVSRQSMPKPFMQLGGSSLLAQAIERGQACGTDDCIVVSNQDFLFLTRDVVKEMNDPPHVRYLLEPRGRNTAPAIALAALACAEMHGAEAIMLVLPADHLIFDSEAFVANALEAAHRAAPASWWYSVFTRPYQIPVLVMLRSTKSGAIPKRRFVLLKNQTWPRRRNTLHLGVFTGIAACSAFPLAAFLSSWRSMRRRCSS